MSDETADVSLSDLNVNDEDTPLALAVGRALFLWALNPMMLTRPDTGAILDANPAACRTLGLSVEEIRARGREGLRDPADDRWTAGFLHRAHTGSYVGELSMQRGDGTMFPAEVSSALFEAHDRQYAVLVFRDISEQRATERRLRDALEEMSRLATTDQLTGLLNRRGFMTVGHTLEEQAHRNGHPLVVLTADVDGLKSINDRFGHAAGDDLLRDVAATLTASLRTADVIARLGGDEFGVILTGARAAADAAAAVERINDNLEKQSRERWGRPVRVSIGIASGTPGSAFSLYELLRIADDAMYAQKPSARRSRR
ncbi:MAG TPA: sensor domain-containing diguanylate cyclase [Mycobacteriales bacterium]|nr:sensor domain-containing diguanylate cyclase [Mycobacteriales bacterium]